MEQRIYEELKKWTAYPLEDPDLQEELEQIIIGEDLQDSDIIDRFYKDLEFGTGGLRGLLGVGSNRMNIYTVARATQGYTEYLKESGGKKIAIAFDSRMKSEVFARVSAEVFAEGGLEVFLFSELVPTPVLSFVIRELKCDGGIVITASHNPAEYNGYKVYGSDGSQITDVAAEAILNKIRSIDIFEDVHRLKFEEAIKMGRIQYINCEMIQQYIQAVSNEAFAAEDIKDVSVVYTPLNGTGLKFVLSVLEKNGFYNVTVVEEQRNPDGNFTTCKIPNPEKKEALFLGIQYAEKNECDMVLATDPDCDRVGVAIKDLYGYRVLNGNEIGILLLDYICKRRRELGNMPKHPICMKTIVTTDLAFKVGKYYGVEIQEVLTGFKYIGEQINMMEHKGEKERFILGIEESHGYLSGTYVRDKDGVNASLLLCEMVEFYKKKRKNLIEVLDDIYARFGYCLNTQYTYSFEGASGADKMKKIMEKLRHNTKNSFMFLDKRLLVLYDYLDGWVYRSNGGREFIQLPQSNVCKMVWENETSLVVRPSGTEPKLKIYLAVNGNNRAAAEENEHRLAEKIKNYIAGEIQGI